MKRDDLPSLGEVVSDEYLERVIATGCWTPHGEYIDRYFEDIEREDLLEDPIKLKDHLKTVYFPNRHQFVVSVLAEELEALESDPVIMRAMKVPTPEWPDFKRGLGTKPLGLFWSTSRPDAHCADNTKGIEVLIRAAFNHQQVDWVETLRSRMDYSLGDEEEEIQLMPEVIPCVLDYEFCSEARNDMGEQLSI